MTVDLLRNALKLATAAFLTAAIAVWNERIADGWQPLPAVAIVVDDNDGQTLQAACVRVMGTLLGTVLGAMLLLVGYEGLPGLPLPLGLSITLGSLRLLGGYWS